MGLLDKLFGKKTSLKKTSEMMAEEQYWNLIQQSLVAGSDRNARLTYLEKALKGLTPTEIIGFHLRTGQFLYDTYTSELWCAGYIMMGGCSDDAFDYFRQWIISRGKETYYAAKENPDSLVKFNSADGDFEFEDFWYVATNAFERKTDEDLHDYIDGNFPATEGNYPEITFNWEEENPESMKRLCPKLYNKFWNA